MAMEQRFIDRFEALRKEAGNDKLALLLISAIQLQTEVLQEHAEERGRALSEIFAAMPFDSPR
jgi:hypothetical protein